MHGDGAWDGVHGESRGARTVFLKPHYIETGMKKTGKNRERTSQDVSLECIMVLLVVDVKPQGDTQGYATTCEVLPKPTVKNARCVHGHYLQLPLPPSASSYGRGPFDKPRLRHPSRQEEEEELVVYATSWGLFGRDRWWGGSLANDGQWQVFSRERGREGEGAS